MSSIAEQFQRGVFGNCKCKKCGDCDRPAYSGNMMGGMCCFCNDDRCYYGREWDEPKTVEVEKKQVEESNFYISRKMESNYYQALNEEYGI